MKKLIKDRCKASHQTPKNLDVGTYANQRID